jgi:lipopolysaccharide transport system ATP-binding protein
MTERIIAKGLGKQFRSYHPDRPWTLQEAVSRRLRRMKPVDYFWALKGINLSVPVGRMFGVIGANGSGKSTLLRLLGGVMRPDQGRLKVNGRIGALLELGAGFHHDLTGRENVFVNGVLGGLTRRELAQRFDSIVRFAELENSIENPLRTYSTGMQMRLAFATAIHVEPEVLLIDEVLSVGDLSFQQKCFERIIKFKEEGCSIILVSHDVLLIKDLCDEVVWLKEGEAVAYGKPNDVVDAYIEDSFTETRLRTPDDREPAQVSGVELVPNKNRFGSLEMQITDVRLLDQWGVPVQEIQSGSPLRVEIHYDAPSPTLAPIFKVCVVRDDGLTCYDVNNERETSLLRIVHGKGRVTLDIDRIDLNSGSYFVDIGIFIRDWSYAYDYHSRVYPLVISGERSQAILFSPHRWVSSRHDSEEVVETTSVV